MILKKDGHLYCPRELWGDWEYLQETSYKSVSSNSNTSDKEVIQASSETDLLSQEIPVQDGLPFLRDPWRWTFQE